MADYLLEIDAKVGQALAGVNQVASAVGGLTRRNWTVNVNLGGNIVSELEAVENQLERITNTIRAIKQFRLPAFSVGGATSNVVSVKTELSTRGLEQGFQAAKRKLGRDSVEVDVDYDTTANAAKAAQEALKSLNAFFANPQNSVNVTAKVGNVTFEEGKDFILDAKLDPKTAKLDEAIGKYRSQEITVPVIFVPASSLALGKALDSLRSKDAGSVSVSFDLQVPKAAEIEQKIKEVNSAVNRAIATAGKQVKIDFSRDPQEVVDGLGLLSEALSNFAQQKENYIDSDRGNKVNVGIIGATQTNANYLERMSRALQNLANTDYDGGNIIFKSNLDEIIKKFEEWALSDKEVHFTFAPKNRPEDFMGGIGDPGGPTPSGPAGPGTSALTASEITEAVAKGSAITADEIVEAMIKGGKASVEASLSSAQQLILNRLSKPLSQGGFNKPGVIEVIKTLGGTVDPKSSSEELRRAASDLVKTSGRFDEAFEKLRDLRGQLLPEGQKGARDQVNRIFQQQQQFANQGPGEKEAANQGARLTEIFMKGFQKAFMGQADLAALENTRIFLEAYQKAFMGSDVGKVALENAKAFADAFTRAFVIGPAGKAAVDNAKIFVESFFRALANETRASGELLGERNLPQLPPRSPRPAWRTPSTLPDSFARWLLGGNNEPPTSRGILLGQRELDRLPSRSPRPEWSEGTLLNTFTELFFEVEKGVDLTRRAFEQLRPYTQTVFGKTKSAGLLIGDLNIPRLPEDVAPRPEWLGTQRRPMSPMGSYRLPDAIERWLPSSDQVLNVIRELLGPNSGDRLNSMLAEVARKISREQFTNQLRGIPPVAPNLILPPSAAERDRGSGTVLGPDGQVITAAKARADADIRAAAASRTFARVIEQYLGPKVRGIFDAAESLSGQLPASGPQSSGRFSFDTGLERGGPIIPGRSSETGKLAENVAKLGEAASKASAASDQAANSINRFSLASRRIGGGSGGSGGFGGGGNTPPPPSPPPSSRSPGDGPNGPNRIDALEFNNSSLFVQNSRAISDAVRTASTAGLEGAEAEYINTLANYSKTLNEARAAVENSTRLTSAYDLAITNLIDATRESVQAQKENAAAIRRGTFQELERIRAKRRAGVALEPSERTFLTQESSVFQGRRIASRQSRLSRRIEPLIEDEKFRAALELLESSGISGTRAGSGYRRSIQRGRAARRARITNEAVIGGAFPLLFGAGIGSSLGGGLGGVVGGLLGPGGGFGGSLVGSFLGQQFDTVVQGIQRLSDALKSPTDTLSALEQAGFRVSDSLKSQISVLESVGRAYDAQSLALQEVERRLGAGSGRQLSALNNEQKRLQEEWSRLTGALQGKLLPAFVALVSFAADLATAFGQLESIDLVGWALGLINIVLPGGGFLAEEGFRQLSNRGRDIAAGKAGDRPAIPDDRAFDAETTRIQEARKRQDLQREIERGARNLAFQRVDVERNIADQRRAESDYEREIADYRWDLEQRIFELRSNSIRAELEVSQAKARLESLQIEKDLGQEAFEAGPGPLQDFIEAEKTFLQTKVDSENQIITNKIEAELRIEQLKQEQINRERQLIREAEDFERKREELLRGRADIERAIGDYQIAAADYQRETAERVLDAWRLMVREMQAAASLPGQGAMPGQGGMTIPNMAGLANPIGPQSSGRQPNWNQGLGAGRGHQGQDIGVDVGTSIHAIESGVVTAIIRGFGRVGDAVQIAYDKGNRVGVYGHVNPMVAVGSRVSAGQQIAIVTSDVTRRGNNTHLHYEEWEGPGRRTLRDPTARLRAAMVGNSTGSTAMQGPNTRPDRPIGTPAVLNGAPVRWNGIGWQPVNAQAELAARTPAVPAQGAPVVIPAPSRPAMSALSATPDTSAVRQANQVETGKQIESAQQLQLLLDKIAQSQEDIAFQNFLQVAQGPQLLSQARDRLKVAEAEAGSIGVMSEQQQEQATLLAQQGAEYRILVGYVDEMRKRTAQRVLDGQKDLAAGKISIDQYNKLVDQAEQLNTAFDKRLVDQAELNRLAQKELEIRQKANFDREIAGLERDIRVTGAGFRAGYAGPVGSAFEEGLTKFNTVEEARQFAERTQALQDAELIWGNLVKDITNVSDAIATSLTQGLADIITGARDIKDVGKELLDSLANTFLDSAQQQISVLLQRSFVSKLGGEGGFLTNLFGRISGNTGDAQLGVGPALSSIPGPAIAVANGLTQLQFSLASFNGASLLGGGIGNIFGGGGGGGGGGSLFSSFGGLATNVITSAFTGGFGGFLAEGGPTLPGQAYIVGEEGPELFVPGVTGRVVPNNEMQKFATLQAAKDREPSDDTINVRYEATEIAGERYVTEAQFRKGMQRAAMQGRAMAYSGMRNSGDTRKSLAV